MRQPARPDGSGATELMGGRGTIVTQGSKFNVQGSSSINRGLKPQAGRPLLAIELLYALRRFAAGRDPKTRRPRGGTDPPCGPGSLLVGVLTAWRGCHRLCWWGHGLHRWRGGCIGGPSVAYLIRRRHAWPVGGIPCSIGGGEHRSDRGHRRVVRSSCLPGRASGRRRWRLSTS